VRYCSECGNALSGSVKFCPNCGTPAHGDTTRSGSAGPQSAAQTEQLFVEAEELGIMGGASLVSNLTGGRNITRCRFVARIDSPAGAYEIAEHGFIKMYSTGLDDLVGVDRKAAQDALDALHHSIMEDGWRRTDIAGARWNSRTYARPFDPARTYGRLTAETGPATSGTRGGRTSSVVISILAIIVLCVCGIGVWSFFH
jgi:hypothetical protein